MKYEQVHQSLERGKHVKIPRVRRETFDPKNEEHLRSLSKFAQTGNWGDVHFFVEFPHTTVPATVMQKYVLHQIGHLFEVPNEAAEH